MATTTEETIDGGMEWSGRDMSTKALTCLGFVERFRSS
jgi:hypothetical protein